MNKFNGQTIIDQHLPERLSPDYYEMLSPSHESNTIDNKIFATTAAYLRNNKGQRKYSGNKPIGFIITREAIPGFRVGILHFYVEGNKQMSNDQFKSDGIAPSRRVFNEQIGTV